jgi:hypothetical protein
MGDPMNDAEILTTRTISMAAALLSLRDTLATDTITGDSFANWFVANKWLMNLFCALLLLFVVFSNLRLFRGLDQDLRTSVSRILSSVITSSMRDSRDSCDSRDSWGSWDSRFRAHSGANEAYHSSIGKMLDEESYRKVIHLQRDLQIDQMSATEGKRWVDCEKRSTMCRKITEGLVLIILLVVVIIGMVVASSNRYVSRVRVASSIEVSPSNRVRVAWLMTLLPTVLYIIMEVLVWRTKQRWAHVTTTTTTTATATIIDEENPQMNITLEVISPVHESNKTTTEMTPPPSAENDETVNPDAVSLEMTEINTKNTQLKPMIRTPSSVLSAHVSELAKRYEGGKTQHL